MEKFIIDIPDKNFKHYLLELLDENCDGFISNIDCLSVDKLDCCYRGIKSLEGIQYFKNLKGLYCCGNELTELHLKDHPSLEVLFCTFNNLHMLDLFGCPNIEQVFCCSNKLKTLHVGNCLNLTILHCAVNELESLDLRYNDCLDSLELYDNDLKTLLFPKENSSSEEFRKRHPNLNTQSNRLKVKVSN